VKKLTRILGNAVLAISILLLLGILVAPSLIGLKLETILSGSMEPYLKIGTMIVTLRIAPADVRVGDVIAFKVEGMDTPVCHRVTEVITAEQGGGFKTKGDANEDPDPWVVNPDNLLGKVIFNLPWVGYFSKFIKTPRGFGLVLGIPSLIVMSLEIKNIFSKKRHSRRHPRLRQKPSRLWLFLPVTGGLIFTAVLWSMMAGNAQEKTLESFAKKSEETTSSSFVSTRIMQNGGKLPLVICLSSEDKSVTFSEKYLRLSPGATKEIKISGDSGAAIIKMGGLFPILPQQTLYQIFVWNPQFAPLVVAAVWILPLTIICLLLIKAFSTGTKRISRAKYMRGATSNA
jgi:signal peptidase I